MYDIQFGKEDKVKMGETAKFKKGDRVKVVRILTDVEHRGIYLGREFTIKRINPNKNLSTHYSLTNPSCFYVFFEDELELIPNPDWIRKPCNVRSFIALECPYCHKTLYALGKYYPYCPYCGNPVGNPDSNENAEQSDNNKTN